LRNTANRQTNKLINADENITSLVEVIIRLQQYSTATQISVHHKLRLKSKRMPAYEQVGYDCRSNFTCSVSLGARAGQVLKTTSHVRN